MTRSLTLHSAPVGGLARLVHPILESPPDRSPSWVTDRGGDCRAYDRREMREVYGPSHTFLTPTDLLVTNGITRFWVGNRNLVPFVNVSAFRNGVWREVGCVGLGLGMISDVLTDARLVKVTPEVVTVSLLTTNKGEILLSLHRGERMIRGQHGSDSPSVPTTRAVQWLGTPPALSLTGVGIADAKFGNGLTGSPQFWWPRDQSKNAWSISETWHPTAASTSQGDSGLASITDKLGVQVGDVRWVGASDTIQFTLNGVSISSAALTYAAGAPVFWCARFDTTDGMALTVRVGGATQHVVNASPINPGTASDYDVFVLGRVTAGAISYWGSGTWGTGTWGGVAPTISGPGGTSDNVMIFGDRLTDAEAASLALADVALGNLPAPESRLVWYAPGDARISPVGAALASGRRDETTADALGFTRSLAGLRGVVTESGFAIGGSGTRWDFAVILGTTGTEDDAAAQHSQFAAASEQRVLVR